VPGKQLSYRSTVAVGDDLGWVRGFNRDENRLGVAVQLCTLPWLGWIPAELTGCPELARARLAAALGLVRAGTAELLAGYGGWQGRTRRDHRAQVLALVAGQDVEPAEGSDGRDGRWRIACKVVEDRVISTVDTQARHTRKSPEARRDGYRAHVAADPDTGIITDEKLTGPPGRRTPTRRLLRSSWPPRPLPAAVTVTMTTMPAGSSPGTAIRPTVPGICALVM
jgi:hypothetical protein